MGPVVQRQYSFLCRSALRIFCLFFTHCLLGLILVGAEVYAAGQSCSGQCSPKLQTPASPAVVGRGSAPSLDLRSFSGPRNSGVAPIQMARAQAPALLRTASTRIFGPKTSRIISQALAPDDFSLILFPDTQNEAQYYPHVLASEPQWVPNNRTALNIQAVLGLGDIVNDGASTAQQQNADAAIRTLDNAGIPYLLAIGNHYYDAAKPSTRMAIGFNNWFGPSRYANYAYYQGSYPPGSNENFYGVLTINGQQYLFLILEYVPRDAALNWAASILQANQDKEVIVVTHSYMFKDNTRVDQCDTKDLNSDNYGDKTWSKLISQYPNIVMVVSGHVTTGNAARRADLGVNGNLVNQMFSNYQTLANGGDGWLRLLTFHPSQNTIDVSTYSPYLNSYQTDSKNQFTIYYHDPHLSAG